MFTGCLYPEGTKHRKLHQLVLKTSSVTYFIPRTDTGNCLCQNLVRKKGEGLENVRVTGRKGGSYVK